jgi:DNA-binding XRE family transcriptional regulator
LSQRQLAEMAGISRQQVLAVESGKGGISLRAALALTRALGLSVEEVFGPAVPAPSVGARPVAPVGEGGSRVVLASVGDTFVALPLTGAAIGAGFAPASGLTANGGADGPQPPGSQPGGPDAAGSRPVRPVRPIGPRRPAVIVVAGDDPALPLLQVPLSLLDPPLGLA